MRFLLSLVLLATFTFFASAKSKYTFDNKLRQATYLVPSTPELIDVALFAINVRFDSDLYQGTTLSYQIPEDIAGPGKVVRFSNPSSFNPTVDQLRLIGSAGEADCRLSKSRLICQIAYTGDLKIEPKKVTALLKQKYGRPEHPKAFVEPLRAQSVEGSLGSLNILPRSFLQNKLSLAAEFIDDPVGVITVVLK